MHGAEFACGFHDALEEFGLPYRAGWDLELPAEQANKFGACEAVSRVLQGDACPKALLFFSDWMALGGRLAAWQAHLRVLVT